MRNRCVSVYKMRNYRALLQPECMRSCGLWSSRFSNIWSRKSTINKTQARSLCIRYVNYLCYNYTAIEAAPPRDVTLMALPPPCYRCREGCSDSVLPPGRNIGPIVATIDFSRASVLLRLLRQHDLDQSFILPWVYCIILLMNASRFSLLRVQSSHCHI